MTQHLHREITAGCYRCDLNMDEVAAAMEAMKKEAEREAACPGHDWIARGIPGDEYRECWLCGKQEDAATSPDTLA